MDRCAVLRAPKYKDDTEREAIEATLVQLKAHIARQLASDEDMELPCELDLGEEPDESDLRGWCIGFMEGVFMREAVWFEDAEEEVSELLLPIMVGSGLFDEQPEFADIADNPDLVDEMVAQIPELLTALYLICHAPEENRPCSSRVATDPDDLNKAQIEFSRRGATARGTGPRQRAYQRRLVQHVRAF